MPPVAIFVSLCVVPCVSSKESDFTIPEVFKGKIKNSNQVLYGNMTSQEKLSVFKVRGQVRCSLAFEPICG